MQQDVPHTNYHSMTHSTLSSQTRNRSSPRQTRPPPFARATPLSRPTCRQTPHCWFLTQAACEAEEPRNHRDHFLL